MQSPNCWIFHEAAQFQDFEVDAVNTLNINELNVDKTNKVTFSPIEDSDQPEESLDS